MQIPRRRFITVSCVTLVVAGLCSAQTLTVTPSHAGGVYQVGEVLHWNIECQGPDVPASFDYTVKKGGLVEVQKGTSVFANGHGAIKAVLDEPQTLLLEVKTKSADGTEQRALGGAVAAPEKIAPAAPRPADFDEFWEAKLQELQSVPANPQLQSADSEKPDVQYWKITMDNVRGKHIQGQLARPAKGEKFPAMLIPQWAGIYGLEKASVTDRAAEGWLVLNISHLDLPIDQPKEFYEEQKLNGPVKDYWEIGNDDRDTSFFLPMYLSCYRGVEYLWQRPDWDGKTLVVIGGSQGAQQALVAAALNPKITAAMAIVPAGCDMRGPDVGPAPGFPMWYYKTTDKDPDKVHRASEYYEVANFVPRIKCPVLVGLGLIDEICPPAGIIAAMNQVTAPKEVFILPLADHPNTGDSHAAYSKRCWGEWLPALRQGQPAPVKQ